LASQLSMIRTHMNSIPRGGVPRGYSWRRYRRGDAKAWVEMVGRTICPYTEEKFLVELRDGPYFDRKRLFFIVHKQTGRPVATACAGVASRHTRRHGYVHFVAVLPEYQGKGLGKAIMRVVLRSFARRGFSDAILHTDDCRKPALKLYLDLGFVPRHLEPDHPARWAAVLDALGVPPIPGVVAMKRGH